MDFCKCEQPNDVSIGDRPKLCFTCGKTIPEFGEDK